MQNVSRKPNSDNNIFVITATVILLLFVTTLYFHSIHERKTEYGDKWKQSVYTVNPFQIDIATDIQSFIHEWNKTHGITGDEGAIIEAMTIGYKSEIPKTVRQSFSRAGVSHILALSGFHVSIIYIILQLVFLTRIVTFRWRWVSQLLVIIMLWLYAFMAGMSPSLVRAVIMCTIFTISKLHTNKLLSLRALLISAIVMLLIEPLLIFHIGFQLSFLSMLGIQLVGVPLCEAYNGYTFIDRFVWCTIIITLVCSLITFPLVAYTFGQLPLLGIFTNLIITPLTYCLFFLLFVWALTFGLDIIAECMMKVSHYILLTVSHVANLPYSTFEWQPSLPTVISIYFLIGVCIFAFKKSFTSLGDATN